MPRLLKLSVAARLAGVSRAEIQDKIRAGAFETFEGKVAITDLMRVYPQVDLDHDPMLEQVERTKANARAKPFAWERDNEGGLPPAEVLAKHVHKQAEQLAQQAQRMAAWRSLADMVRAQLERLVHADHDADDLRAELLELATQIADALAEDEQGAEAEPAAQRFMHLIAAQVTLVPSGHGFLVDGGDSLLQAAVRAGLSIGYGCNDGSCGQCKARVIEGRVVACEEAKYVLSAHERRMGYALMCCNTALTDVTLEVGEVASPEALPPQDMPAVIAALEPLEDGMISLRVKVSKAHNFRFFAGQSAQLVLPDGRAEWLPLTSCPCDGSELEMVADARAMPAFAAALGESVGREGARLAGPAGDFVLREMSACPSLFIAHGAGFSRIKSLLEHAVAQGRMRHYELWRFAPPDAPLYLENCCRAWADAMENFRYRRFAEGADTDPALREALAQLPPLVDCDAYVAGAAPFVDRITHLLTENGLPTGNLKTATA